jgi:glycosyltransferase involved in cell wall biosynthesis
MKASKKALIVTYYWPPGGGSGVQRWMYFARYLERFGIEPVVITVDPEEAAYQAIDETLSEKVAHVRTYRTGGGFQLLKLYASLKRGKTKNVIPNGDFGDRDKTLFDRIAGYIRANYFIPDARVGWVKKVVPLAEKLLAQESFDFLITTGPPHSAHLVGIELKKRHDALHWIADFRDPWREIYYNDLFKRGPRADKKDASLEQAVIDTADTILTVGPSMKELLERKTTNRQKVRFIYNGYDSEQFDSLVAQRYPEFTLAHIGMWTGQQPFEEIAGPLRNILASRPEVRMRFVIAGGNVSREFIDGLLEIDGLIVDFKGRIGHREAVQEMMNADLLLNCLPPLKESKIMISGKMMEYIATGNPVLAIGDPEGDAAQLLSEAPDSRMVFPGDAESVEKRILELLSAGRPVQSEQRKLTQYSRLETTRQLAELLKSL